ncbi:MAG: hypothetical protein HZB55_05725 [Deltaproteobacteria bacterium]|nr:hypothetical protein [Deltaproteobacteria bacterium]
MGCNLPENPLSWSRLRGSVLVFSSLLVLAVGVVDWLTGIDISFSIFYVIPISLAAWFASTNAALAIAGLSTVTWLTADLLAGHSYPHRWIPIWNAGVRLGFFLITVMALRRLRIDFDERAELVGELRMALEERRRNEELWSKKIDELSSMNVELEQYAYFAAHDLKSPLVAIGGFAKLLRRRLGGRLEPELETLFDYIVSGVDQMQRLINDLLLFARAATREEPKTPTDANRAFDQALVNVHLEVDASSATVIREDLPSVVVHEQELVQIFQNLIANAVKFRGQRAPRVHARAQRSGSEWIFSVEDNGIGIASADSDRIFGVFQRLHSAATYAGTGLGLAICKKIVERCGGRIWVESQPGSGSTFFFTIPDRHDSERARFGEA